MQDTFFVHFLAQKNGQQWTLRGPLEKVRSPYQQVSILSGLNIEKIKGFLSPGTKQAVHNNEVPVLSACL